MVITDGENYGKTISLADDANLDSYYEITEEEYNKKMSEVSDNATDEG